MMNWIHLFLQITQKMFEHALIMIFHHFSRSQFRNFDPFNFCQNIYKTEIFIRKLEVLECMKTHIYRKINLIKTHLSHLIKTLHF